MRNFKYLDDMIQSGAHEIILDSDIVLDEGEEAEYSKGIDLDVDRLSIDGNGHTIDAKGKARIFNITAHNVMIRNITFKNGFSPNDGGAISGIGVIQLKIEDSQFKSNASKGKGGAIFNHNRLILIDCLFDENESDLGGGAIYNCRGCKLYVCNSSFANNSSGMNGGAIDNFGDLKIEESVFKNNKSKGCGGAIASDEPEFKRCRPPYRCIRTICDLFYIDCEFENNNPDDVFKKSK